MITKKAAMFGLDARIALAIFGALSVITGAALFSAIKDAKVVQVITELYIGIDKKIDGSVDSKTGRVRHFKNTVSGTHYVFIKYRAKLN